MSDISEKVIQLEKLKFDSRNPRLPIRLQGVTDESKVIDYMVKYGNIVELMLSIAETGYSNAEPLLVVADTNQDYTVVEGNRRLAALKLISNPGLTKLRVQAINDVVSNARHKPTEIPCILYSKREDVLDYLGYRHITGVKDWGALEKARYLNQLYQIHIKQSTSDTIYPKLAKMIGSRTDYVRRLHQALRLYEKANEEAYYSLDISEEDVKFSWLYTALSFNEIRGFLNLKDATNTSLDTLDESNYEKLFKWMFSPGKAAIRESRQISEIAKIVDFPLALERLENGGTVEEAILYTSEPSEAFINMLKNAREQLKQAKEAIEQLSEEPLDAKDILKDIDKLTKTIGGALNSNFNDNTENTRILEQLAADPDVLAALKKLLKT